MTRKKVTVRRGKNGVSKIIRGRYSIPGMSWGETREFIFRRDNYTCQNCNTYVSELRRNGVPLQVNHIRPISRGGATTANNLETICGLCHTKKRGHSHMKPGMREEIRRRNKNTRKPKKKYRWQRKF